jgi:hypothetical protein
MVKPQDSGYSNPKKKEEDKSGAMDGHVKDKRFVPNKGYRKNPK